MNAASTTLLFKLGAIVGLGLGAFFVAYGVAHGIAHGRAVGLGLPGHPELERYAQFVRRVVRTNGLRVSSGFILRGQAVGILGGVVLAVGLWDPRWLVIAVFAALLPPGWLVKLRSQRIAEFDKQASGFVLMLANALKATPNVGAALEAIQPTLRQPFRQEIAVVLAEMQVGTPVDAALLNASARIGSRSFDNCVAALLVGRKVGGNLPDVLETTAGTMREMGRLEGVVQTRTAEGRAQLLVLLVLPAVIAVAFSLASPGYFEPLQRTWVGRIVMFGVVLGWLSALWLARTIMAVDL